MKECYRLKDVETGIKNGKFRWIGHLERMDNRRFTKRIHGVGSVGDVYGAHLKVMF